MKSPTKNNTLLGKASTTSVANQVLCRLSCSFVFIQVVHISNPSFHCLSKGGGRNDFYHSPCAKQLHDEIKRGSKEQFKVGISAVVFYQLLAMMQFTLKQDDR